MSVPFGTDPPNIGGWDHFKILLCLLCASIYEDPIVVRYSLVRLHYPMMVEEWLLQNQPGHGSVIPIPK